MVARHMYRLRVLRPNARQLDNVPKTTCSNEAGAFQCLWTGAESFSAAE